MHRDHQWGPWMHPNRDRIDWEMKGIYRYCVSGYCPMAQYRNGRVFKARPERQATSMRR